MPLSTINSAKDLQNTYMPLLLATVTFPDASVLRLSTAPLNTAEGGFQYSSNNYVARILNQTIDPIQGQGDGGIELVPRVSLTLADPDKVLWTNYERASGKGFRGSQLSLLFLLWDADTSTFSSDTLTPFIGICGQPSCDEMTMTLTAFHKYNLQRKFLPVVPIQRRCPWIFPVTAAQRQAGADQTSFLFKFCGYSPDASGGNARGNYVTGTTPYTVCNFTKDDCVARGMYKIDSSVRVTGRFAGTQFDVPDSSRTRDYLTGQWLSIAANQNLARYGDYYPIVYGTAVVAAKVMPLFGDGNSTRFEAVVCVGKVNYIHRVVVNDRIVPPATDVTGGTNYIVRDKLFRYNVVNQGNRSGVPNIDVPYSGNGDPYGSLCTILVVVPRAVQETSGVPRVDVLVQGPAIRVYTDATTYTETFTDNPVWVALDELIWAGLDYSDFDLATWVTAAAVCDVMVTYTDQYGNSASRKRYACSYVLSQRRSAADVIRGIRNGCNALISINPATGKIQIMIRQTLADQQGSAPDGSNYVTGISSFTASGSVTNGYVAYDFTAATIARSEDMRRSSFRVVSRGANDIPNSVSFRFTNSERDYAEDSIRLTEQADLVRMGGQEIPTTAQVEGVNTIDQAKKIASILLAESLRGNAFIDTRGTEVYEFETTFRAVKLRVGHICRVSEPQHGITNQLVRILSIQPTTNWERAKIVCQFHSDLFYLDSYGQANDPELAVHRRNRLERPSYPWVPGAFVPNSSIFSSTDWGMGIGQAYDIGAEGALITKLLVQGNRPVNVFSEIQPPIVQRQGTTASTGGSIRGFNRVYWIAICAIDSDGLYSAHSLLCQVIVTASTNTNTITLPIVSWDAGSVDYAVFAGESPSRLSLQTTGTGTPSSVTLTSFKECADYGLPDPEFDKFRIKIKRIRHSGVWFGRVQTVGTNALQIEDAVFTLDQFVGYDMSVVAQTNNALVPVYDFEVVSNFGTNNDVFDLVTDPSIIVSVGDYVVLRSKPTVGSDGSGNYLEDAGWLNGRLNGGVGLAVNSEIGKLLRIFAGTGRGEIYKVKSNTDQKIYIEGEWITTPDSTTRYVIEDSAWVDEIDSESLTNSNPVSQINMQPELSNYLNQLIGVQVVTLDGGGNESIAPESPWRDIFVIGNGAVTPIDADYDVLVTDRTILVDATAEVDLNMPSTQDFRGRIVIKRVAGTADINIVPDGSDTTEVALVDDTLVLFASKEDENWFQEVSGTGGGGGGSSTPKDVLLVGGTGTTTISQGIISNSILVVRITQPPAGGELIAWSADFAPNTPTQINTDGDAVTIITFMEFDSLWYQSAPAVNPILP